MDSLWANIALVLVFILIGGVFAASEIALVSLRESQIRGLADRGRAGETVARLAGDSNRFLSAVQVGVTLAGFFSASFGAAKIAPVVAGGLEGVGMAEGSAYGVARPPRPPPPPPRPPPPPPRPPPRYSSSSPHRVFEF